MKIRLRKGPKILLFVLLFQWNQASGTSLRKKRMLESTEIEDAGAPSTVKPDQKPTSKYFGSLLLDDIPDWPSEEKSGESSVTQMTDLGGPSLKEEEEAKDTRAEPESSATTMTNVRTATAPSEPEFSQDEATIMTNPNNESLPEESETATTSESESSEDDTTSNPSITPKKPEAPKIPNKKFNKIKMPKHPKRPKGFKKTGKGKKTSPADKKRKSKPREDSFSRINSMNGVANLQKII